MTGLAIARSVDGDFGAALGAARLGMMAAGMPPTQVCARPPVRDEIMPDAGLAERLASAREEWQHICHLLKGLRDG